MYSIKIDDFLMELKSNSTKPGRKEGLLSSHSPIKIKNVQCENFKNSHMCNRFMIINSIRPKYRSILCGCINIKR